MRRIYTVLLASILILGMGGCGVFKKLGKEKEIKVLITTSMGDMKVKLYNETPLHRDNFVKLVNEGFYDSLLFHRVISKFMIQGGDPDSKNAVAGEALGNGGPGYTIPAEFNDSLIHKKGVLAAARMGDYTNPKKESSGSQFYIVQGQTYDEKTLANFEKRSNRKYSAKQKEEYATVGGTPHLDGSYTVFGEVYEGLDVLDKIASVATANADRPLKNVWMKMKIIKK